MGLHSIRWRIHTVAYASWPHQSELRAKPGSRAVSDCSPRAARAPSGSSRSPRSSASPRAASTTTSPTVRRCSTLCSTPGRSASSMRPSRPSSGAAATRGPGCASCSPWLRKEDGSSRSPARPHTLRWLGVRRRRPGPAYPRPGARRRDPPPVALTSSRAALDGGRRAGDDGGVDDLQVSGRLVIPASELTERFSRSSGPGGQGVNTADSRVELRWDISTSRAIGDTIRERLLENLAGRLSDGVLTVAAQEHRTQLDNRRAARDRLAALVRGAAAPPPPARRATRPTRGSQTRRLDAKRRRSEVKRGRGRAAFD